MGIISTYIRNKEEERRLARAKEINKMPREELENLKIYNNIEIERLDKEAIKTHSTLYRLWLTSQIKDLTWENELIMVKMATLN